MAATITNGTHSPDWEDRYYHVDQVLDRPGPRTDPDSFMAGDSVRDPFTSTPSRHTRLISTGKELPTEPVQDPSHRCGWARM